MYFELQVINENNMQYTITRNDFHYQMQFIK